MPFRILVVEDDPITRAFMESGLRSRGIEAVCTPSAEDGMRILQEGGVDLILMDLQLAKMDGVEAASRIRAGGAGASNIPIPIVALTGTPISEVEASCRNAGINGYLEKPFHLEELVSLIQKWCGSNNHQAYTPSFTHRFKNPTASNAAEEGLNLDFLLRKFDCDRDYLALLVKTFQEDTRQKFIDMRAALEQEDWRGLARMIHSLKGAAGVLELKVLREEAEALEEKLRKGEYSHIKRSSLENLEILFQNTDLSTILEELEQNKTEGRRENEGSGGGG